MIPVELTSSAAAYGWLLVLDLVARKVPAPKFRLVGVSRWVVGVGFLVGARSVIPVELSSSAESHGWLLATDLAVCWVPASKFCLAWARIWLFGLGRWSELGS